MTVVVNETGGRRARRPGFPNTTMGDPDGPDMFIPELGEEVPTFVDERKDLIPKGAHMFIRLKHHVPFKKRGLFKPDWWPQAYQDNMKQNPNLRFNFEGFVMCTALNKAGDLCSNPAVNRTLFCRNHGGALHPADKKMSNESTLTLPADRVARLDRVQKYMQGLLNMEDLDEDEIVGAFIRNDQGVPIANKKLGVKIQQDMVKELHARMTRYMQMKLPGMLKTMAEIAESDLVEPADRIKAAQWVAERIIGKTPDVLIHGKTDKPYETIFDSIESTSREAYRAEAAKVTSQRVLEIEPTPLDVSVVDDGEEPDYEDAIIVDQDNDPFDEQSSSVDADGITLATVSKLESKREVRKISAKEQREKLQKAKARRFAARAVGATNTDNIGFAIEMKVAKNGNKRIKLWCADDITEAVAAKIAASPWTGGEL